MHVSGWIVIIIDISDKETQLQKDELHFYSLLSKSLSTGVYIVHKKTSDRCVPKTDFLSKVDMLT